MLALIMMTRLPRVGGNKTRLIPALGARGAMEFHDRLVRHTMARASAFCRTGNGRKLRACIAGGTAAEGRSWLGELDIREQADGDLGVRMRIAAAEAFTEGAEKVVIIGTDCPGLDEGTLSSAESLLTHNDLVFGPALDGGYYLIGLAKPVGVVFQSIPWGGSDVLAKSLEAAEGEGLKAALLAPLADVDVPDDLPAAMAALGEKASCRITPPAP